VLDICVTCVDFKSLSRVGGTRGLLTARRNIANPNNRPTLNDRLATKSNILKKRNAVDDSDNSGDDEVDIPAYRQTFFNYTRPQVQTFSLDKTYRDYRQVLKQVWNPKTEMKRLFDTTSVMDDQNSYVDVMTVDPTPLTKPLTKPSLPAINDDDDDDVPLGIQFAAVDPFKPSTKDVPMDDDEDENTVSAPELVQTILTPPRQQPPPQSHPPPQALPLPLHQSQSNDVDDSVPPEPDDKTEAENLLLGEGGYGCVYRAPGLSCMLSTADDDVTNDTINMMYHNDDNSIYVTKLLIVSSSKNEIEIGRYLAKEDPKHEYFIYLEPNSGCVASLGQVQSCPAPSIKTKLQKDTEAGTLNIKDFANYSMLYGGQLYAQYLHDLKAYDRQSEVYRGLISLWTILVKLHSLGIAHRDITPGNILW
jgi:hypothetical protein